MAQDLNDGLLLKYEFNNNANDASGNGFDGIANATLATDRNGMPNACYFFNGSTNYIDFPNVATLKPQLPVSISFWVKFSSLKPGVLTTDFAQDIHTGVWVALNSEGKIAFSYGDGGPTLPSGRRTKIGETNLQTGKWYHILGVVRDAIDMDIFINGINDCGVYTGSGGTLAYSNSSGSIGRKDSNPNLPPHYFHGYIDDFYYWNREVEINEIYNISSIEPPPMNFLAFTVPEQIGTSLIDTVNNTINLTINCSSDFIVAPSFQLSNNAKVYINSIEQISDVTPVDFSTDVTYTVVNSINCSQFSKNWVITLTKETAPTYPTTDILSFTFSDQIKAQIDTVNKSVNIVMPCFTKLSDLVASFILSDGAEAFVGNILQNNDVQSNNFTSPVIYSIINKRYCTMTDWTVLVTNEVVPAETSIKLTSFNSIEVENQSKPVDIENASNTIIFEVTCETNLNDLALYFTLDDSTTFSIDGKDYTSGESFNLTENLIVLLANNDFCSQQEWTIKVHQLHYTKTDLLNEEKFFIPNIITPNQDAKNDFFKLGESLNGSSLTIVNRYGTLVYQSRSYQNDFNGASLSEGIYYYAIDKKCYTKTIKGTLSIIR